MREGYTKADLSKGGVQNTGQKAEKAVHLIHCTGLNKVAFQHAGLWRGGFPPPFTALDLREVAFQYAGLP